MNIIVLGLQLVTQYDLYMWFERLRFGAAILQFDWLCNCACLPLPYLEPREKS